jgi:hypothetical protein
VQQTKDSYRDDEQEHGPMKCDGRRAITVNRVHGIVHRLLRKK